jgi:hypothetical protein
VTRPLRRNDALTPEETAEYKQWAANRTRLITTDPDAARILTIDPSTVNSTRQQVALSEQITQYVATKHANGQPYDGLWSSQ